MEGDFFVVWERGKESGRFIRGGGVEVWSGLWRELGFVVFWDVWVLGIFFVFRKLR